jgi:hypothetical protein
MISADAYCKSVALAIDIPRVTRKKFFMFLFMVYCFNLNIRMGGV